MKVYIHPHLYYTNTIGNLSVQVINKNIHIFNLDALAFNGTENLYSTEGESGPMYMRYIPSGMFHSFTAVDQFDSDLFNSLVDKGQLEADVRDALFNLLYALVFLTEGNEKGSSQWQ